MQERPDRPRRYGDEPPPPKSRVLHTRVTDKLHQLVRKAADIDRRTVSDWISRALDELARQTIDRHRNATRGPR